MGLVAVRVLSGKMFSVRVWKALSVMELSLLRSLGKVLFAEKVWAEWFVKFARSHKLKGLGLI